MWSRFIYINGKWHKSLLSLSSLSRILNSCLQYLLPFLLSLLALLFTPNLLHLILLSFIFVFFKKTIMYLWGPILVSNRHIKPYCKYFAKSTLSSLYLGNLIKRSLASKMHCRPLLLKTPSCYWIQLFKCNVVRLLTKEGFDFPI